MKLRSCRAVLTFSAALLSLWRIHFSTRDSLPVGWLIRQTAVNIHCETVQRPEQLTFSDCEGTKPPSSLSMANLVAFHSLLQNW